MRVWPKDLRASATAIDEADELEGDDLDPRARLDDFAAAIEREPANPCPLFARGSLHAALGDVLRARGGDPLPLYRTALSDWELALGLAPSEVEIFAGLGCLHVKVGAALEERGL